MCQNENERLASLPHASGFLNARTHTHTRPGCRFFLCQFERRFLPPSPDRNLSLSGCDFLQMDARAQMILDAPAKLHRNERLTRKSVRSVLRRSRLDSVSDNSQSSKTAPCLALRGLESAQAEALHCSARVMCNRRNFE